MPEIPTLFEEELSDILAGLAMFEPTNENSLIYTKSDAWKHENEWRIFAGTDVTSMLLMRIKEPV